MKATPGIKKIIEDSKAKGYIVKELDNGFGWDIRTSPRGVGVTIWGDGTATRNDVELHLTTTIRTHNAIRQILKLPA